MGSPSWSRTPAFRVSPSSTKATRPPHGSSVSSHSTSPYSPLSVSSISFLLPTRRATLRERRLPSIAFYLTTACAVSHRRHPSASITSSSSSKSDSSPRWADGGFCPATLRRCGRVKLCTRHWSTRLSTRHGRSAAPRWRRFVRDFSRPRCGRTSPPWSCLTAIQSMSRGPEFVLTRVTTPHTRPVTRPLLPRISHEIPTSYAGRWCQGEVCAGGGSDPLLRSSRVGSAALVAPAPLHIRHPKISDADISLICAGYKPDQ